MPSLEQTPAKITPPNANHDLVAKQHTTMPDARAMFTGESESILDYEGFVQDHASPDEYRGWLSIRAATEEQRSQLELAGEAAYDTALEVERSANTEAALPYYKEASGALTDAIGLEMALETESLHYARNPARYFKIADAFRKQAAAAEIEPYSKPGAVTTETKRVNHDRRAYLGRRALSAWENGLKALMANGAENGQPGVYTLENPTELAASAVAEAIHDVNDTREHSILKDAALSRANEKQLAEQLHDTGLVGITRVVTDKIATKMDQLEVVGLSSEILNDRLTVSEHLL